MLLRLVESVILYGVGQGDALELLVVHGTTETLELIAWEDDLCG